MNKILQRVFLLKPFDESKDAKHANEKYDKIIIVMVVGSFVLTVLSLILAVIKNEHAVAVLSVTICLSAITSGFEWSAGLKGRACNQLFVCVLGALFFKWVML